MDFSSEYYLPNSEERIKHLRRIIAGRPVAILAAGPSIMELEKRSSELRHADICYFGLNSFVQETHIVKQIGKRVSVFFRSCGEGMSELMEDILNFLNRDEDNMFVSSFWRNTFEWLGKDFDLNQFLGKYDRKLLFFYLSYNRTVPNRDSPLHFVSGNSLQMAIQLAVIGKASKIVLFGADGSCDSIETDYYRPDEYNPYPQAIVTLNLDTNVCFNPIMPIAIRNVYKTYNISPIDILNCSEKSLYTPFPNVSYDDAFEYLLSGKKFNTKSDLRVPKLSVISVVKTGDFLKETIENTANQSYSNHEHIIVYNEADSAIRDMMLQFPHARWVLENDASQLQVFRKGISMARGDYIAYCPVGDSYANQDWLGICVEILENHPDTSLVWGLCQDISGNGAPGRIANAAFFSNPPLQGKEFIYSWLKQETTFPEGNLCVRKRVLEECFPLNASPDMHESWLAFNYRFNTSGYLPYFVPIVANYHRTHIDVGGHRPLPEKDGATGYLPYYVPVTPNKAAEGQEDIADEGLHTLLRRYYDKVQQYKKLLRNGKIVHRYRNGSGEVLPEYIDRNLFLSHGIRKYVRKRLPRGYMLVYDDARFAWRKYHWGVFKVGTIRILRRLKK